METKACGVYIRNWVIIIIVEIRENEAYGLHHAQVFWQGVRVNEHFDQVQNKNGEANFGKVFAFLFFFWVIINKKKYARIKDTIPIFFFYNLVL